MTTFSKAISLQRKSKKLSQSDVAAYMSEHGFPLTQKGVSKWECGDTLPNAEQFLQLCRLFEIRDVLSVFYSDENRSLNELGIQRLEEYHKLLLNDPRFMEDEHGFPLFELNNIKHPEDIGAIDKTECLEADTVIPENADFAVRLNNESMSPLFEKGQILFIRKQKKLESGEFGLFIYKGSAICRLYMPGELISANMLVPPIRIGQDAEIEIIGSIINI